MGTGTSQKKKILIIDDDATIGTLIESVLNPAGYETHFEINSVVGFDRLKKETFDLIITDEKMPEITGLMILEWIKTNKPELRSILIAAANELEHNIDAALLGCRKIMIKPLVPAELLAAVKGSLRKVEKVEFNASQFASIPCSEFKSTPECKTSVYVLLPTGHFLQIAKPGDPLHGEHIQALNSRGLFNLWFLKEDFQEALKNASKTILSTAQSGDEAAEKGTPEIAAKVEPIFIKHTCEMATENLRLMNLQPQAIFEAVQVFEGSIKIFMRQNFGNTEMQAFLKNVSLYTHSLSVTTSALAVYVLKVMGWNSTKNANGVVMGAFLRDIGLYSLPPEVREKKPSKMTKEEMILYKSHPELSLNLVDEMKCINDLTKKIIMQHHEKPDGTGFPKGLLRSDISPLSRLVYLIDSFVSNWADVVASLKTPDPVTVLKAMDKQQPLTFERSDVIALEFALSENNLKAAQLKYQKYVAC